MYAYVAEVDCTEKGAPQRAVKVSNKKRKTAHPAAMGCSAAVNMGWERTKLWMGSRANPSSFPTHHLLWANNVKSIGWDLRNQQRTRSSDDSVAVWQPPLFPLVKMRSRSKTVHGEKEKENNRRHSHTKIKKIKCIGFE